MNAPSLISSIRPLDARPRFVNFCLAMFGFVSLALCASSASGQTNLVGAPQITVASFNMGWWAVQAQNTELVQQCNAPSRQWCDTRFADTWPRGADGVAKCEPTSPGLPPCNAFAIFDVSNGSSRTATSAPLQVPTAAYFSARQRAMQATMRRVDADVFALQEISGVPAAREALGSLANQFSFCESDSVPADRPQAQKLVFAWRNPISGSCTTDSSIAVEDEPGADGITRRVRPALVAKLSVGGKAITFINLHLKSGCASPAGDGVYTFSGDYLDSDRPACKTLRRQVAPLETLMKSTAANGGLAMVLGDFNRKIDLETNFRAGHGRPPEGQRCATPLKRGEVQNNPPGIATASDTVCLMWPELNDTHSPATAYTVLRRYARAEGHRCARNEGLDHLTISDALRSALRFAPNSEEVDLATFGQAKEAASDHCPLKATLKFR